jgi:hypothetical protein
MTHTVELAFYRGGRTFYDRLIAWWTKSEFTHVEIVRERENGKALIFSSSPRDGGVREVWCALNPDRWEFHTIEREIDKSIFETELRKRYDWLGILGSQILAGGLNLKTRWFCSEICARILRLEQPQRYSPESLRQFVIELKKYKLN